MILAVEINPRVHRQVGATHLDEAAGYLFTKACATLTLSLTLSGLWTLYTVIPLSHTDRIPLLPG